MWVMRIVAGLMLIGIALGSFGCQGVSSERAGSSAQSAPPLRPVRELRKNLVGKSMAEVVAILGQPSDVFSIPGGETWSYKNACRDSITGRPVRFVGIDFQKGQVAEVNFAY